MGAGAVSPPEESGFATTRGLLRNQQKAGQRCQVQELPKKTQLAGGTCTWSPVLCYSWGSHLMLVGAEATEGDYLME